MNMMNQPNIPGMVPNRNDYNNLEFKSEPNKTTSDNVKLYLQKKNMLETYPTEYIFDIIF